MLKSNQSFTVAFLLIGVVDLCLWMMTIVPAIGAISPTAFVLLRCIFILVIIGLFYRRGTNPLIPTVLATSLFVAFSLFGILALWIVMRAAGGVGEKASLYHIDNEEGEEAGSDVPASQSLVIDELRRVSPLIDGMTDDSKDNRIAAIQAMEQVSDSTNIRKILLEAKLDPHKEVQYYANDALNKVNDGYMDRIKELLDKMNNMAEPDIAIYLELADMYAAVADAGIDHPVLLQFYAQEAVKYYFYVLDELPEDSDENEVGPVSKQQVLKKLMPTLYSNKEFEKCIGHCKTAAQYQNLQDIANLYRARCLFKLKKLRSLKEFSKNFQAMDIPNMDEFLAFDELP